MGGRAEDLRGFLQQAPPRNGPTPDPIPRAQCAAGVQESEVEPIEDAAGRCQGVSQAIRDAAATALRQVVRVCKKQ